MDLTKYNDAYLHEGVHAVTVTAYRLFDAKSGNHGVEFTLVDANGAGTKVSFILTEKNMFRLKSFVRACGYKDLSKYDHARLINHNVQVRVVRREKYHEVDTDNMGWWLIGAEVPAQPQQPPTATATAQPAPDDDIPFGGTTSAQW